MVRPEISRISSAAAGQRETPAASALACARQNSGEFRRDDHSLPMARNVTSSTLAISTNNRGNLNGTTTVVTRDNACANAVIQATDQMLIPKYAKYPK